MANEIPRVIMPNVLLERMSKANTKRHAQTIGIEIARETMDNTSDAVDGFAVGAPFGNVKSTLAALGKIDVDQI